MVIPRWITRWGRRSWQVAWKDLTGVTAAVRSGAAPSPGLYTYHVYPPGGSRILHLRVGDDGRSVLLVDVNDAIHLNATAALLAKMALDGQSCGEAAAALRRQGIGRGRADRDARTLFDLIDRLKTSTDACPTCGLTTAGQKDWFSVPVEAPYKADLALTYGCNNACGHCYNEQERSTTRSLTFDQWKQVLDRLHAIGIPHIIFTGGEPTLHANLVELVEYAQRQGLLTGINSNGRRFADKHFTHAVAEAGLGHLQVTLHSHRFNIHNAMTGARSFDETVAGIRRALDAGLHTITNTTLTQKNSADAEGLVEFLCELGLKTFAMNGMIHSGAGCGHADAIEEECLAPALAAVRDQAAELGMRFLWYTPTPYCRLSPVELQLGPKRCNAGQYTIAIEPDGSVLPCQSYYQPVGNILRDPWSQIWNSRLFRSFRDRVDDPRGAGLPEMCWECPDMPLCAGGCRIAWEAETDSRLPIVAGALRDYA